ncbi:unnamed protein product [Miscanthus lutarioriparius]|uniref:Uncharacterized protein n=1 Tax=Miscanthus lutarioriparius TaxID=422564 RepID=A0A811NQL2_9POAL|nr:unnamed protein product [Miscanthus lutarioriparius]
MVLAVAAVGWPGRTAASLLKLPGDRRCGLELRRREPHMAHGTTSAGPVAGAPRGADAGTARIRGRGEQRQPDPVPTRHPPAAAGPVTGGPRGADGTARIRGQGEQRDPDRKELRQPDPSSTRSPPPAEGSLGRATGEGKRGSRRGRRSRGAPPF